jgi:adenosylhomocysteine nucleosidase
VKTWLLVAAERREFDGIRKRLGRTVERQEFPAKFVCEGTWNGERWMMVANGPGRKLVNAALSDDLIREARGAGDVRAIVSTGYCGGLDPKLQVGDIVVSEDTALSSTRVFVRGAVNTRDRVAVTAAEKSALREQTGALAVDMEAEAVCTRALALGIPYACIRVVSDTAGEDMPLDFNRYRDAEGRFSRTRIALAAMARPFSVMPKLMEFDRRCQQASMALGEALGDFLADCRF